MDGMKWRALAAVALGLAGCDLDGTGGTEALTASEVDCATITPDLEVDIVDNAFEPNDARVEDGGVVRWTHRGQEEHTVTSGSPLDAGTLFDSGDLFAGDTFCLEFRGRGTATYFCEYHPIDMLGASIEVGRGAGGGGEGGGGGEPEPGPGAGEY